MASLDLPLSTRLSGVAFPTTLHALYGLVTPAAERARIAALPTDDLLLERGLPEDTPDLDERVLTLIRRHARRDPGTFLLRLLAVPGCDVAALDWPLPGTGQPLLRASTLRAIGTVRRTVSMNAARGGPACASCANAVEAKNPHVVGCGLSLNSHPAHAGRLPVLARRGHYQGWVNPHVTPGPLPSTETGVIVADQPLTDFLDSCGAYTRRADFGPVDPAYVTLYETLRGLGR